MKSPTYAQKRSLVSSDYQNIGKYNTHNVFADERLELLYLLPELPDELDVGVLVDGRLVDDVLGAIGVAQGGQGLAVIAVGRADGRDHDGTRVAAQRVLEQPGQHAVAVGYVGAATRAIRVRGRAELREGGDDRAQGHQGLVYVGTFFETLARCAARVGSLAGKRC